MKKFLIIAAIISMLYAIVWMSLAYPYRLFPSDDDYFQSFIENPGIRGTLATVIRSHHPVLLISLLFLKIAAFLFTSDLSSILLLHAVISNSIILFLIMLFVHQLTGSIKTALMSALLYGTAAWPMNYGVFYSYTPFSTMLSLAGLFLIYKAYEEKKNRRTYIFGAGVISGLYFWSSPAALPMTILQCLLFVFISREDNAKEIWGVMLRFIAGLLVTFLPFVLFSAVPLFDHITENIRQQSTPTHIRPPLFSFFYILGIYNWFLVGLFFLASFLLWIYTLRRKKEMHAAPFSRYSFLFAIVALILLHSWAVDVLPSTKLARTQFVLFPLLIVAISASCYFMSGLFSKYKKIVFTAGMLILAAVVVRNIQFSQALIKSRLYTPRYLKAQLSEIPLFVLAEDSHAEALTGWLRDFPIQIISKNDLGKITGALPQGALLLGPRGVESGKSILSNCCLDDFYFDGEEAYFEGKSVVHEDLPYFAYFPSFMLEEETCMGLFLAGQKVDYTQPQKNLMLISWQKKP